MTLASLPKPRFLLRKLVDMGVAEAKMDIAVDRYVKEKSSLEQSSATAGVSLWRFLDELRQRKVALNYSMADAEAENREGGRQKTLKVPGVDG